MAEAELSAEWEDPLLIELTAPQLWGIWSVWTTSDIILFFLGVGEYESPA